MEAPSERHCEAASELVHANEGALMLAAALLSRVLVE